MRTSMAGSEVTLHGRIGLTPEDVQGHRWSSLRLPQYLLTGR